MENLDDTPLPLMPLPPTQRHTDSMMTSRAAASAAAAKAVSVVDLTGDSDDEGGCAAVQLEAVGERLQSSTVQTEGVERTPVEPTPAVAESLAEDALDPTPCDKRLRRSGGSNPGESPRNALQHPVAPAAPPTMEGSAAEQPSPVKQNPPAEHQPAVAETASEGQQQQEADETAPVVKAPRQRTRAAKRKQAAPSTPIGKRSFRPPQRDDAIFSARNLRPAVRAPEVLNSPELCPITQQQSLRRCTRGKFFSPWIQ